MIRSVEGWLPEVEPCSSSVLDAAARLGLGLAPSEYWGLADTVSSLGILDQGYTPSCVSQAFAGAVRLRADVLGFDARPSRRWLHRKCRQRDQGRPGAVPVRGTYISTVCAVSRDIGWPSEEHHPWDDARSLDEDEPRRVAWVDEPVGATAAHHAHDQRYAVQEHAVLTDEESRAVLSANIPIEFGMTLDDGFRRISTWEPYEVTGESIGGHAMYAFGYGPEGVGVVNSWSKDFGVGGLWLMSWRAWRTQARDKRALEIVRRATS